MSSQAVCKACVLLEGLNSGLPNMGVSRTRRGQTRRAQQPIQVQEEQEQRLEKQQQQPQQHGPQPPPLMDDEQQLQQQRQSDGEQHVRQELQQLSVS